MPFKEVPVLNWITTTASYSTNFTWLAEPAFAIGDPQYNVGNSIQNARTIQIIPQLNFISLYNKIRFLRDANGADASKLTSTLVGLLTSIKIS